MPQKLNVADLKITSPAFSHHQAIPERHTGDGEDVSPELALATIDAVEVLGAFRAPEAVKAALASRTT